MSGREEIDRRVEAIGAGELGPPVRAALGDRAARVSTWRHHPVAYDFLNPSSGGVWRFAGTAERDGRTVSWTLVLKVTRPAGSEAIRADRELLAYETGFLGRLDGDLVAAACHGWERHGDGSCSLWLEDLGGAATGAWPLERWALVGRALGAFNGRFLVDGVPDDGWLGRGWLRTWVEDLTPVHFARAVHFDDEDWLHPEVRAAYPEATRGRLAALWDERAALLAAADALPHTCSHLDAHRRNLFLDHRDGRERIVAIDWGLLGLAPVGQELASTLVGTVAAGEAPAAQARALGETLLDAYLLGLADAGWHGDERDVQLGFAASAALRVFSVLGLDAVDDGRSPDETAAELGRCSTFADYLLELADEARALVRARA